MGRRPAIGLLATALASVIAVVLVLGSGGGGVPGDLVGSGNHLSELVQRSPTSSVRSPASSAAPATTPSQPQGAPATQRAVEPQANGRRQVQSAQLALTTPARRLDTVAQEAFGVIGQENGIVEHSRVNATAAGGDAELSLSVPNANLQATMTRLSTLRYAAVASRNDSSDDVNNRYLSETRRLADARALRTSLLRQLAAATTQQEVNSLKARVHDVAASISSDEATLAALNHRVAFSRLQLTINAGSFAAPGPPADSGGFTLHTALHDAVRVLTVGAGVALIALAVLVPLGLLLALGLWVVHAVRRRGREQALDAA